MTQTAELAPTFADPIPSHIMLRPYCDDDLSAMLFVIRSAFAEYQGLLDPPSSAERKTLDIIREELVGANAAVAIGNGRVIGCVFCRPRDGNMYLDRLSVLPGWRGLGIGDYLIRWVENEARRQELPTVHLSVRIPLKQQQAYYAKRGYVFSSFGTHTGYLRPTYLNLAKSLALRANHY
ncbi:GNAT family N-acetyltransferase [Chitinivorax sp. B]|uniref:GNAT family N-acetyltransferase n=1 Tax=Chitinivorax sp. B TaxID=2502235 RepID=UPI0010F478FB|nr:GNAT family N-acetyltransferase [Chitinivorax sp. B]